MVELLEDVRDAQEKEMKTALVAIKLSAAFDMCCNKILLEKCCLLALDHSALVWIKSFLKNQSKVVDMAGTLSTVLMSGSNGVFTRQREQLRIFPNFTLRPYQHK